jgi:hypothetical protein
MYGVKCEIKILDKILYVVGSSDIPLQLLLSVYLIYKYVQL